MEEADQRVWYEMEVFASLRQMLVKIDAADVDIDAIKIMLADLEKLHVINVRS